MRLVGFFALVVAGLFLMGISDDWPWYFELPAFLAGYMILTETVRADERHRNGL